MIAFLLIIIAILAFITVNNFGKISELNNSTTALKEENEKLTKLNSKLYSQSKDLENYDDTIKRFASMIDNLKKEKDGLESIIGNLESDVACNLINTEQYENISSEECKNKLALLKVEVNDLIKNDKAIKIFDSQKSKKEINANKKQILLCFNNDCSNVINNLTLKNADTARSKIERSFNNINKIFEVDGLRLEKILLEKKLQELTLVYSYLEKKEQEKEEQRAIREQMLEEEKVRREIEREKSKIEKEESQFKNEITKLMGYMQKSSDVEKQLYVDKIRELEDKLKALEKDKENVLEREENTRAGFVYIISNIGSFGENVYKIGMTRRLEPMDRIKELGDASVPFEFDVHAMIFSADAPALETTLHNTFRGKEVNKVNLKKEFYKVSLDEIEKVVKENHNATVTFTKIAEAAQYRETLKIEQKQK